MAGQYGIAALSRQCILACHTSIEVEGELSLRARRVSSRAENACPNCPAGENIVWKKATEAVGAPIGNDLGASLNTVYAGTYLVRYGIKSGTLT